MSDIPPTTSNVGIPCDDSQDCPQDMWCRDVGGRKRCQRTVNPNMGLYISLGVAGFIILVLIFVMYAHLDGGLHKKPLFPTN